MQATLSINTTKITEKVKSLSDEVLSRFPDGIPDRIHGELSSLCDDIVFTDFSSAFVAGGTNKIVQAVDFGARFDAFTAALRAGNFDVHGDPHSAV
nr:hypothetical protein [Pectobacterium carotovorum]OYN49471.1 hypothetical protein B7L51_19585 [Pectobacterium carotovorum]